MNDSNRKRRYSSPKRNGINKNDTRASFLSLASRLRSSETNGIASVSSTDDFFQIPIPSFDQIDRHGSFFMKGIRSRTKDLDDLNVGDVVICKVLHISYSTIEIQPVCMLTRFRRILNLPQQKVEYDKSNQTYKKNDFIRAKITNITNDLLNLQIDYTEAIKYDDLPFYYRRELDLSHSKFDENPDVKTCLKNNNLSELLRISIDSSKHSFLSKFHDQEWIGYENEAKEIRNKQNHEISMSHVVKGTKLVKEKKYGDAILCFTQALNIDDANVEAYVGRGAACANNNNFDGALNDFNEALRIEPTHINAIRYKSDVLACYGNKYYLFKIFTTALKTLGPIHFLMTLLYTQKINLFNFLPSHLKTEGMRMTKRWETDEKFNEAQECYEESIELAKKLPNHKSKAYEFLERLRLKNRKIEIVTIEDSDQKRTLKKEQKSMSKDDRKKLIEYEKLIADLKRK